MLGLMEVIDKVGREITNEIKDLNYTTSESFKDLKTSMVKELNEINSSLDFNVLLNGIQTYQIYKLNKNTKSLR
jgi:replicative DNA helicase